jgi:hypothetical protein
MRCLPAAVILAVLVVAAAPGSSALNLLGLDRKVPRSAC